MCRWDEADDSLVIQHTGQSHQNESRNLRWTVMSYSYKRSNLLSVIGMTRSTLSSSYPILTHTKAMTLATLGPPSLSFKYLPDYGHRLQKAETALSLDRIRYLTFLDAKATETFTYSYGAYCVYESCNNPAVMLSFSFPILSEIEELQGTTFALKRCFD